MKYLLWAALLLMLLKALTSLLIQPAPVYGERARIGLPIGVLIAGAAGMLLFGSGTVWAALNLCSRWLVLTLLAMNALSALAVMAWGRCVLIVAEDGVIRRDMLGTSRRLSWEELERQRPRWMTLRRRRLIRGLVPCEEE